MIFLPFLIVCLSFFASCASPPGPRQAILVVLDAARPDHFSCYGYDKATTPEIDRLSRAGAVFLNCYAQGTETRTSLPRLLYSRYFSPEIFPNHLRRAAAVGEIVPWRTIDRMYSEPGISEP
jgi:hypothetical protein